MMQWAPLSRAKCSSHLHFPADYMQFSPIIPEDYVKKTRLIF